MRIFTFRALLVFSSLALTLAIYVGCDQSPAVKPPAAIPAKGVTARRPVADTRQALRDRIDRVIEEAGRRNMTVKDHAAWQVIHGALAYGNDLKVHTDDGLQPALPYLFAGGGMRGWNLKPGDHGLDTVLEAGSKTGQGHEDQWIGYLSLVPLDPKTTIVLPGVERQYTLNDMLTQAQWDIYEGMEASWTLMALSTYLPLDAEWTAKDGSQWNLERIIAMEAKQDINDSACGGTHRLVAMTVALDRYLESGKPLQGGWAAANKVINDCVQKAQQFRQPDGCFSNNFFARPGISADLARKIYSTGHTLEFVVIALPDDRLNEPWLRQSVEYMCELLEQTSDIPVECGGLYHGIRGLQIYRQRVFDEDTVALRN